MKICIVTVYDSINCGSYWQAFVLGHVLEKKGHTVLYLKRAHQNSSNSIRYQMITYIKRCIAFGTKDANTGIKNFIEFRRLHKMFKTITADDALGDKDVEAIILGSDTIWDMEEYYFSENFPVYWGEIFFNKTILPYAASCGNTKGIDESLKDRMIRCINSWNKIGVRDNSTRELILPFTDRTINVVLDPTLLLKKEQYSEIAHLGDRDHKGKYLLLYIFNKIPDAVAKEIRNFAETKGLTIVALTHSFGIGEVRANNHPHAFINAFYYADYVITDTFHGTAFSINFNKQFLVIDEGKNKIHEMLQSLNLEERLWNVEDLSQIYNLSRLTIDYSVVNRCLEKNREKSYQFLDEGISGL